MGLLEGYHVGKDLAQSLADKNYESELAGIKTPDQIAAERNQQADGQQSAGRVTKQLANPVQIQSTGDIIANASQPAPAPPGAAIDTGGQKDSAPAPASSSGPTLNDQMDYIRQRAAVDIKHGKMDTDGVIKLGGVLRNMQQEGLLQSIAKMNAGDIAGGADMYNGIGNHRVKVVGAQDGQYDAGGVKVPTKLITVQDANGNQETINTASFLDSALGIQHIVEQAQKGSQLANEATTAAANMKKGDAAERRAAALENIAASSGGITLPQQRINYEIEAARKYIKNLDPVDIKKRTVQYSATGRDNPDYDPTLAVKVRQANRRKYGNDDYFDTVMDNGANGSQPDITARFSTDPAMKGHHLGNKTPQGVEVLDASGKLIGHYN